VDTSNRSGCIGLRIKSDYWAKSPKVRDVHGRRAELKLGEILVFGFKGGQGEQGEQGSIAWHEYHTGNRLPHGNFCIQAIILDIPSNT
jgi:hypothetical protein